MKNLKSARIIVVAIATFISNQSAMTQNIERDWVRKMIQAAELSISSPENVRASSNEKATALANSAKKFLPIGMRINELAVKLSQLKEQGFIVTEYHRGFAREWPNGKPYPYRDADTQRNISNNIPPETYAITAVKTWRSRFIVEEFYSVDIQVSERSEQVFGVEARRSATSF
jgi:hypothetical protein